MKLQRLCSIGASVNLSFLCDSNEVIPTLSAVAVSKGITLNLLVEINVGANRCGVDAGKPAAILASEIDRTPGLTFAGLQAYHGSAQHLVSAKDRQSRVLETIEKVQHSKTELAKLGLDREWVTGSGTGSFPFERDSGIFSEVQAGSYAFMDSHYAKNKDENGNLVGTFSLTLLVIKCCKQS